MNTNKITIEDVTLVSGVVTVDFIINDGDLQTLTVTLNQLKQFALNTGLNEFVFDYSENGNHVQVAGSHDIDLFMDENLKEVLKCYLEIDRLEKSFARSSAKMTELIALLNA
jgi:hypothetical protein